jgi:hypothetical protein
MEGDEGKGRRVEGMGVLGSEMRDECVRGREGELRGVRVTVR